MTNVLLHIDMAKDSEVFLHRESQFWVVKPRLGLRGVSGLSTLVSGAYIEVEPGKGATRKHFVGLEAPPVIKAEEAGTRIVLLTRRLGSVDTSSPIFYQGIVAGEVLGYELGNDRKSVFVHAFIKAPYDELVRGNTRFWNVSGIDVSVGSEGLSVRTESISSLLFGGIAFETLDTLENVKEDVTGLVFTLHDTYKSIQEESFTRRVTFVMFFDGSVRGLTIGAPVEFKGIKIGAVTDIRLEFDRQDSSFRIPVLVEIEPDRVIERGEGDADSALDTLETLVARGLRARLQTGSLLTGQLFVELDMHPETTVHLVNADVPFPELPTIPASLAEITSAIRGFVAKLEKIEFGKIAEELHGTLQGTNRLINAPELQNAVRGVDRVINSSSLTGALDGADRLINSPEILNTVIELKVTLATFRSILHKVDQRIEPIAENLAGAIAAGRESLQQLETTLILVNEVLQSDSPLQSQYIQMADELADTARAIRTFVELLERNPESVIFGKNPPGTN